MLSSGTFRLVMIMACVVLVRCSATAETIDAQLHIDRYPSPFVSDWDYDPGLIELLVSNLTGRDQSVIVEMTFCDRYGTQLAFGKSSVTLIPSSPSVTVLNGRSIIEWETLKYPARVENMIIRTGRLPEGTFRVCARLLSANGEFLCDAGCSAFQIVYPDPPSLFYPEDNSLLFDSHPVFQWTPVIVPAEFDVNYIITIKELLGNQSTGALQTKYQAWQNNPPLYIISDLSETVFDYPISAPLLEHGKYYVWGVQVVDENGSTLAANGGRSEVWQFTVAPSPIVVNTDTIFEPLSHLEQPDSSGQEKHESDGDIYLAGTILDAETGLPISEAAIEYRSVKQTYLDGSQASEKDTEERTISRPGSPLGPEGPRQQGQSDEDQQSSGQISYVEQEDSYLKDWSDENGNFSVSGVAAESFFSLIVTKHGYEKSYHIGRQYYQQGSISNLVLEIEPGLWSWGGRITDSVTGEPISNAVVRLTDRSPVPVSPIAEIVDRGTEPDASYGFPRVVTTDTDGRFLFENMTKNRTHYLEIQHYRYQESKHILSPTYLADHTSELMKLVPRTGGIEVMVKNKETGRPVRRARAYLFHDYDPALFAARDAEEQSSQLWTPTSTNTGLIGMLESADEAIDENRPLVWMGDTTTDYGVASWLNNGSHTFEVTETSTEPVSMPVEGWIDFTNASGSGECQFNDVLINHPDQETDRYAVWVQCQGYYDTWVPARLSVEGQRLWIVVELTEAAGMVTGTVTDAKSGEPIGDATVRLLAEDITVIDEPEGHHRDGGRVTDSEDHWIEKREDKKPYIETYSNPDGSFTLHDIQVGSYEKLVVSKSGYRSFTLEDIQVELGIIQKVDAPLERPVGVVRGKVSDDKGQPVYGAGIRSPDMPWMQTITTNLDGSFFTSDVLAGSIRFEFTKAGYPQLTKRVKVEENDTVEVNITLVPYKGHLKVVVTDGSTGDVVRNAEVTVDGSNDYTDAFGSAVLYDLAVGDKKIAIKPPESEIDYIKTSIDVTIERDQMVEHSVVMKRGARIAGRVERLGRAGQGIEDVQIAVRGNSGVSTKSRSDGTFELRRVPVGNEIILRATRVGYKSGSVTVSNLVVNEHRQGVVIQLDTTVVDSIFGFAVQIDSEEDIGNGHKRVTGNIVDVKSNDILKLKSSGTKFRFEGVEIGSDRKPVESTFQLATREAAVTVFGFKGKLTGENDGTLSLNWSEEHDVGFISGQVVLDTKDDIPRWIPGSAWISERIASTSASKLWSDGGYRGPDALGLDYLSVADNSVTLRIGGFSLSVDYTKTTLDDKGLHYTGKLIIPGIPKLDFSDLNIQVVDGSLKFHGATIKTDPPVTIPMGVFTLVDSSTTWNESGFMASGAIRVDELDREFGFSDLRIDKDGVFLSVRVDCDEENGTFSMFGADFTIRRLEFGTVTEEQGGNDQTRFFVFTGDLAVPKLGEDRPIQFENLRYTQDGEFSGTVRFNQSFTFAGIVPFQLHSIEFNEDERKGKYMYVRGSIGFSIPGVSVVAGNMKYYEDGDFDLKRMGLGFSAGPVGVSLTVSWADDIFRGSGSVAAGPLFSVRAGFEYGGPGEYMIALGMNTNIPIGPITIVGVDGHIRYSASRSKWEVGFGGSMTVGSAEKVATLDCYFTIYNSNAGVALKAEATVRALGNIKLANGTIFLDFPRKHFWGEIDMSFSWNGVVDVGAWVRVEFKAGDYWFMEGGIDSDLFKLVTSHGHGVIGWNYSGYSCPYKKDYQKLSCYPKGSQLLPINGLHLEASLHFGGSTEFLGNKYALEYEIGTFVNVNVRQGFAGGYFVRGYVTGEFFIIGGSAEVEVGACMNYYNGVLTAHAHFGAYVHVWAGACGKDADCWDVCSDSWKLWKVGGKVCFDLYASIDYSSVTGWDFEVHF